jgi:Dna[CI] antecedent DciA-like protein
MAKRNAESKSIKDLMGAFISENNLSKGFKKIKVEEAWLKVMGPGVQSYTTAVKIQNEVLVVHLTSSVLREELGYGKDKIVQMMNEILGESLIKKVRLT